MRFIGTHKFPNDVYLESLSTTTSTDTLVVDSDGKISKNTSIGGDITSLGTLTSLAVTSASDLGSAAMTLTNADIDQIALDINASNTTANVLDINAQALTSGKAIYVDCNNMAHASTAIHFDFDESSTGTLQNHLMMV